MPSAAARSALSMKRPFAALRRSRVYQPLAVLLAVLLAPAVSWMQTGAGGPFQAKAQVAGGCVSLSTSIIQNYCDASGNLYLTDLTQLESDAVNGYLAEHNLPASDATVIYLYGRSDLRSAIRAHMLALLQTYFTTPAASRTPHQQGLYNWMQSLIQKNEISLYGNAVNQYNSWVSDACHFTLDPTIASQYGLSYDGSPWCGASNSLGALFNPNLGVPDPSYFTTYGMEKSYGAVSAADPNYGVLLSQTSLSYGTVFSIAGVAAALISTAIAGGSFAAGITPIITITTVGEVAAGSVGTALQGFLTAVPEITVEEFLPATMVAVPVAIITMAIAVAVAAGMQAFDYAKTLSELAAMNANLNTVVHTPPDLGVMASDLSGQGWYKFQNTLLTRTMTGVCQGNFADSSQPASVPCGNSTPSDAPSAAPLPAHRVGTDFAFVTPGSNTTQESFAYRDWNGANWTVQTWGGWFVQTCTPGTAKTNADGSKSTGACVQPDSITADIYYTDWSIPPDSGISGDRSQWVASRFGSNFTLTKGITDSKLEPCSPSEGMGVSLPPGGDFSACSSYVAAAFNLAGGNGSQVRMQLSPYSTPIFPSPYYFSFTAGTSSVQTIKATGNPTPSLSLAGGGLSSDPDFLLLLPNNGTLEIVYNGNPLTPLGDFTLNVNAAGYSGAIQSQAYTIHVKSSLAITSPDTLNGQAGYPVNFLVTATGNPAPKITADPKLNLALFGLTLTDNGNGTATISGTPSVGSQDYFCLNANINTNQTSPCGIIATNSQGSVEQQFTINLSFAPEASLVPPASATFVAGINNQVLLESTGAVTPVSWSLVSSPPPPSWVSLKDNRNGTATLSGRPPLGTSGTFTIYPTPTAIGSIGISNPYAIAVLNAPVITSASAATFTVGTAGTFGISDNMGTVSVGALPNGLLYFSGPTLDCFTCSQSISGTPAVGTGGQYPVLVTDTSSSGTATQALTLTVNEAPSITTPNLVVLFAGKPASFAVATTGYPNISTHTVAANAGPPSAPSQGNGVYFSASGLPSSLQASNLNNRGLATGTLTISGTPLATDVGTHKVQITAQNAVGSAAQQMLTLQVFPYNPSTPVNLTGTWVFSRDANNNVIATVVVANGGSTAAQNVAISSAKIGSVAGSITPLSIGSIAAAGTGVFTVTFPGTSLGASGTPNTIAINGSYAGGTFSSAGRIVLP